MNRETMQARVLLLQQNVEIQSHQIESLATNLKVLQGHLAEAKHWLDQFGDVPVPEGVPSVEEIIDLEVEPSESLEPCEQE